MGIEFKPEWAKNMDGEKHIPQMVDYASGAIDTVGYGSRRAIALVLASVCEDSVSPLDAFDQLAFISAQLEEVRDNMRAEAVAELETVAADDKTLPLDLDPAPALPLGLYCADIINGVYYVGPSADVLSDEQWELVNPETFRACLGNLPADKLYYAHFSEEDRPLLQHIESVYGLHFNSTCFRQNTPG